MNSKTYNLKFGSLLFVILIFNLPLLAEEKESDFYEITSIPIPEGIVLEGSGLTWLDSNTIAVCGRRGQIYTIQNALGETSNLKFNLYADGLHEPVGLHAAGGWLYATQRGELTRIKDIDGDGRAVGAGGCEVEVLNGVVASGVELDERVVVMVSSSSVSFASTRSTSRA